MEAVLSTGRPSSEWNWEAIVSEFWPKLVRIGCARYGLSIEDCEDVVQQVAVDIAYYRPRATNPQSYLARSFLRECVRKKKGLVKLHSREWALLGVEPPTDPRRAMLVACHVHRALDRLSPRCRELLTARFLEEGTLPESADAAGFSRKTVWKRLQECLRRLLQWL